MIMSAKIILLVQNIYKADTMDEFLEAVELRACSDPEKVKDSIKKYEVKNVSDKFWKLF